MTDEDKRILRDALATGHTAMRKKFPGLALMVQETLKRDPHCGHLFVFRGKRGGLIKVLWHDGQGMCLLAKRLERVEAAARQPEARCLRLQAADPGRKGDDDKQDPGEPVEAGDIEPEHRDQQRNHHRHGKT